MEIWMYILEYHQLFIIHILIVQCMQEASRIEATSAPVTGKFFGPEASLFNQRYQSDYSWMREKL
jgi:hypothetical protein